MIDDHTHFRIVSADISIETQTGMVIFRPHLAEARKGGASQATAGCWLALPPHEVRSLARALLDAADRVEQKARLLRAAAPMAGKVKA